MSNYKRASAYRVPDGAVRISKAAIISACWTEEEPMDVAIYRTAEDVPDDYKTLRSLLDGAQRIFDESKDESASLGQETK